MRGGHGWGEGLLTASTMPRGCRNPPLPRTLAVRPAAGWNNISRPVASSAERAWPGPKRLVLGPPSSGARERPRDSNPHRQILITFELRPAHGTLRDRCGHVFHRGDIRSVNPRRPARAGMAETGMRRRGRACCRGGNVNSVNPRHPARAGPRRIPRSPQAARTWCAGRIALYRAELRRLSTPAGFEPATTTL